MNNLHLESVIEDSITDAALPAEPAEEIVQESTPEPTETVEEPTVEEPEVEASDVEVPSPAAKADLSKPVQDDFEKKFGIPAQSSSGRENRIPYSRVKKITERAVADAKSQFSKDLEASHIPVAKYQELETANKDYEGRLSKVAEFEQVMLNDAPRFLDMLSGIPAYAAIFKQLIDAAKPQTPAQTEAPVQARQQDPSDEMPQPDQPLSDGSMVYSIKGLESLQAWNRAQAKKEIMSEVEKRYAPLETDYQNYQRTQAVLPQVQAQIADARTWPLFNDHENEIVQVLQKYPQASLERAYQHVVWPKLQAEQDKLKKEIETKSNEAKVNRDSVRAEVLQELKKAPKSTSVSLGSGSKPSSIASTIPKTLEEIIAESVKGLKG